VKISFCGLRLMPRKARRQNALPSHSRVGSGHYPFLRMTYFGECTHRKSKIWYDLQSSSAIGRIHRQFVARPSPKRSSLLKTVHFRHLATTINTHFVFSAREIEGAFRLRSSKSKMGKTTKAARRGKAPDRRGETREIALRVKRVACPLFLRNFGSSSKPEGRK